MPDPAQTPHPFDRNPPAAALVGTTAYRPSMDEDVALGCECADPALQIERWGQEALPFPQHGA